LAANPIEDSSDYQHGVFEGEDTIIEEVTGQALMTVQAFVTLHEVHHARLMKKLQARNSADLVSKIIVLR
jgi:hypothetical protein